MPLSVCASPIWVDNYIFMTSHIRHTGARVRNFRSRSSYFDRRINMSACVNHVLHTMPSPRVHRCVIQCTGRNMNTSENGNSRQIVRWEFRDLSSMCKRIWEKFEKRRKKESFKPKWTTAPSVQLPVRGTTSEHWYRLFVWMLFMSSVFRQPCETPIVQDKSERHYCWFKIQSYWWSLIPSQTHTHTNPGKIKGCDTRIKNGDSVFHNTL